MQTARDIVVIKHLLIIMWKTYNYWIVDRFIFHLYLKIIIQKAQQISLKQNVMQVIGV